MTNKKEFIEEITSYGYDGEGVARVEGKVVFVPYVLKGEKILGEIEDSRSSFCKGKLLEIRQASEKREVPPCPYFSKCGGCAYQHTGYQNELEIKKELLAYQLKRIGVNSEIEVIASPFEYGYRNKIRLFVGNKGLALKERASGNLCTIEKCLLVSNEMNRAIEVINSFILARKLTRVFKEVVIRQEGGNLVVNLVSAVKNTKINYQGLFLRLGSNFGIFETYNKECIHKIGLKSLESEEFGLKCFFNPNTFHQVNRHLTAPLYQKAIDSLVGKTVVNCYSGAGVLSGVLAKSGKRVIGIELGENEHTDAEKLKEENSLFYLTNLKGDCSEVLPRLNEKIDSVIVDPPRSGMDKKVISALNLFNFKRLVYISCNSATLVRDLERLDKFTVKSVSLYDMFARTGEYETIVILEKVLK